MFRVIWRSLLMTVILAVILCGIYPVSVYLVGRIFFPGRSTGGIVYRDGKPVGAKLIGQNFQRPEYFHGRPSAAGQKGYDATSSSGSNLGPTNQKLIQTVEKNVQQAIQENPGLRPGQVPVDLVTASGSGLDPHLSPEAAIVQVDRIAKARGLTSERVRELVNSAVEPRQFGLLGEPVVNVLMLNLALDQISTHR
jgi:potassium-transporting ATPase KdpC subunit